MRDDGEVMTHRLVVGFTGTQRGMTGHQAMSVRNLFATLGVTRIVHGGCVGADFQVDTIAQELWIPTEVWPSTLAAKQEEFPDALVVQPPKPPLERNHNIVDSCALLIGAPRQHAEQQRSGTWYTIRYARKRMRRHIIIGPDGRPITF